MDNVETQPMDVEGLPAPPSPLKRTPSGLSTEAKRAQFQRKLEDDDSTTTITPSTYQKEVLPSPTESPASPVSVVVGARPSLPGQAMNLDHYIEKPSDEAAKEREHDEDEDEVVPEPASPPKEACCNSFSSQGSHVCYCCMY